jgi:hypothetical protein
VAAPPQSSKPDECGCGKRGQQQHRVADGAEQTLPGPRAEVVNCGAIRQVRRPNLNRETRGGRVSDLYGRDLALADSVPGQEEKADHDKDTAQHSQDLACPQCPSLHRQPFRTRLATLPAFTTLRGPERTLLGRPADELDLEASRLVI